jgi:hypothetical protein
MKKARVFTGFAAACALGVLVWRIGLGQIAAQLRDLRLALPVILVASLLRLLLQTRAWRMALSAEGIAVPQSRLVAVRLASQAAGYLVALGPVLSEPAKIALLRNPGGAAAAAPATLFETGAYWFNTVILGLAGVCAGMFLIGNSTAVWGAAALFGVALALLAARRRLLSPLVRAAGPRAPGWLRSAGIVEQRIRSFRDRHPRVAGEVLALDAIAQLLTLAEVAAVLWAAGARISLLDLLVLEAAGRLVKIVGAWIPGRIGADEGGAAASFTLLGFPAAAGLMLVLARRVRDLLWCGAGIVWVAKDTPGRLCMEEH